MMAWTARQVSEEDGARSFEARMKTPAMTNAVAVVRPFDAPVPADLRELDVVTFFFAYHDATYMNADRAQMHRRLFAALKPGGSP
jgi:predicted methyltransferase